LTDSIKHKALKGISWNFLEKFGIKGIRFALGIILARLLSPEAFGLIGMITIFLQIGNVFITGGFGQAYVQKKQVSEKDTNTIFYSNLLISILLYLILWYSAKPIANFYDQKELINIIRVLSLIIIINSFNIIQNAVIKRNLDFKRKTIIVLFSTTLSGVVAIIAALKGLGVWSLVIQKILNRLVTTISMWLTSSWIPKFLFSKDSFKQLFSFGGWLLASSLFTRIFDNIYSVIIGRFFPSAILGFYTKARQFQQLVSKDLMLAITPVAFPVFSRIQDNLPKLKSSFRSLIQYSIGIILPILITLMVISKSFVILLLTDKWAPMVPFLQLLCIVGILLVFSEANKQVVKSQGKSKLNFKTSLIKSVLRALNILITFRYGVIYIIIGEIVVSFIELMIITFFTKKIVNYGILKQLKDIKEIVIGGGVAFIFGFSINYMINNLYLLFILGVLITLITYISFQYLFNKTLLLNGIKLIKYRRNKTI
jgi:O-antigen/teichoic acid export membrane protein